jgi:DNA-3-methyladenine glycosylase I
MSLGYLPGAHEANCPVYARIAALGPPWTKPRAILGNLNVPN